MNKKMKFEYTGESKIVGHCEISLSHPVSETKVGRNPKKNEEVKPEDLYRVWDAENLHGGNLKNTTRFTNVLVTEYDGVFISRKLANRLGLETVHTPFDGKLGRKGFYELSVHFDDMVTSNEWEARNIHEELVHERNRIVLDYLVNLIPDDSPPIDFIMMELEPDQVKVLVHGELYWLGAAWGRFNSEDDTFDIGNTFVPVNYTVFRETER